MSVALFDDSDANLTSLERLHKEFKSADPIDEILSQLTVDKSIYSIPNDTDGSLVIHTIASNLKRIKPLWVKKAVDAFPEGIQTANKFGFLPLHKAAASNFETDGGYHFTKVTCIRVPVSHLDSFTILIKNLPS